MEKEQPTPSSSLRESKPQEDEEEETKKEIPSTTRRTRSMLAPDWTVPEMLTLATEVAAVEEDCRRSVSAYQKWKLISDNCTTLDVRRSVGQCRRKWDALITDYRLVRDYESRRPGAAAAGSYWSLECEKRRELGLPVSLDRKLFESIGLVFKGAQKGPESDGDSDEITGTVEIGMNDFTLDSGSKKVKQSKKEKVISESEGYMARQLHENAQQIHAILRGELSEDASRSRTLVDLTKPNAIEMEFTRRQADELIKTLGSLVGTLDRFTELVKEGRCGGIIPPASTSL